MHYLMPVLAVTASVLSTSSVCADIGDQLFKLLPKDGSFDDQFGISVAISGASAIVGAPGDDDNGDNSGSAYIFDTTTGVQLFKLLPDDGAAGDIFGSSVGISGVTAIVGARYHDKNGANSGSAYLFDTITGTQLFKLLPEDGAAGESFGNSVAISGATAIVGAIRDDDNGANSGSAYLFDTITGTQLAKLLPDDGAADDYFSFVAISGTIVIVGAPGDNGTWFGSAYLFDISDPANPVQTAKLRPKDGAAHDVFGISVAISGTTAIVGAWRDDDNGTNSGSAYLFNISDPNNPVQIAKLLADDGAEFDGFGRSVAISGPPGKAIAIVGAYHDDDNGIISGSAYLFDTTTGRQIAKFLPDDGAEADWFGNSVAISGALGKEVAIGGGHQDDDNGEASGSAYLFDAGASRKCPWDLDKSGEVGTTDLLELFAQWGTAGSADFDGSGAVGTADLLILFANWGPCP
ncbi:MAG: FG-GAP repeat protein [Planctomycetes bacterium]|nr:FG-GAP repeat protein [Planctomycetota bacterium]